MPVAAAETVNIFVKTNEESTIIMLKKTDNARFGVRYFDILFIFKYSSK